jgi:haloalkane dehalogenase
VTRVATFRARSPLGLYRSAVGLVKGTQPTMRERLYAFRIPRAYLFGERSLPDPEMERLASQGIHVLVVPKAGHDMAVDNPAGLAEITAEALQVKAQGV